MTSDNCQHCLSGNYSNNVINYINWCQSELRSYVGAYSISPIRNPKLPPPPPPPLTIPLKYGLSGVHLRPEHPTKVKVKLCIVKLVVCSQILQILHSVTHLLEILQSPSPFRNTYSFIVEQGWPFGIVKSFLHRSFWVYLALFYIVGETAAWQN